MKNLAPSAIESFLERFDNFIDAEFRSVEVVDPFEMKVVLAAQDKARDFDWVSVSLLFSEVQAAHLVEENQLTFLDMSDGVSILYEDGTFAFGNTKCYNISALQSASLYIIAKTLKYEEGAF